MELPEISLRYSRFGFSFDYPEGMAFTAGALLGGFDHARPFSGDVQGVIMQIPELVGVIWFHADASIPLDVFLNELFAVSVEAGGFQELSRGSLVTSTKDGHEMAQQAFDIIDAEGASQTGVLGVWYEEEEQRIYVLYTVTLLELSDQIDLNARFQQYLDSFDSEGWEPPTGDIESYWPTEGWRFALPEDVGIDPVKLEEMVQHINADGIGADSVMVIKDGYVVLDAYFPTFDEGELHIVYSCTKSVVSTLIGMAYEEGLIESLDQPLLEFFPGRTVQNVSQWKEEITLRDMLTMSAGFDARDNWIYEWEWLGRLHDAEDAVQYMLDLEVVHEPGTVFNYTNGVSHLLSCIVTETTGVSALEYAQEKLFGPLGITHVEWDTDVMGRNWGYSRLYLEPRDMAKIGYLFFNEGEWDGQQIVSSEWVEDATSKHLDANLMPGYGYQWWVHPNGYYTAIGYKGQFIHVVPDLDLIMVTTSRDANDFNRILDLLETYVIPAVID
ncbi:MAG: serine hydrolase [Candidatus Bathyarchaeota archaeon]|nr:MAG: serine hydrolase [Candidatus Bathyarchaeota archaeon]